ncbi:MAG: hypothetical protein ABUL42_03385 [Terricaulis silvestris]
MKSSALHAVNGDDQWTFGGRAGEPADYCSREGAVALKEKIEAYWRERGQDVMLSLHNVGFHPAIRAARFDVRSDMVNGLPRTSLKAPSASQSYSMVDAEFSDDDGDVWIDP